MHQYGIEIDKLHTLIAAPAVSATGYGSHGVVAATDEYRLEQFIVNAGASVEIELPGGEEMTLFVEEGLIEVQGSEVSLHQEVTLAKLTRTQVRAREASVLYGFTGPIEESSLPSGFKVGTTEDYRDKYWGNIQTMVNARYTGKRLFFQKGQHSSLHFHCDKTETYFIHSGELLVRLRAGRGEDRSFTLKRGDTLLIPPGLMHQDGGIQDTVIIEVSTHDVDSDSFIVEDGATTNMPGLPS